MKNLRDILIFKGINLLFHAATSGELSLQQWRHKTEIPSLRELFQELHHVSVMWFNLGIELEIPVSVLYNIQSDHRGTERCFIEMLQVWLKISPQPTWEAIVNALKSPSVGEPRLAMEIEAKYLTF